MTGLVRAYVCTRCHQAKGTKPGARGRLPTVCPECSAPKPSTPPVGGSGVTPPALTIVRDPFNSTPFTEAVTPSAVHSPSGDGTPGPIEQKLIGDLDRVVSTNPLAATLGAIALRCARAADLAPADDLKGVFAAVKELRAIMAEISKASTGGDEPDGFNDTPVGPSRPEVRNTPTW